MRTCGKCGGSFPDGVKFCPEDGAPLPSGPSGPSGAVLPPDPLVGALLDGRYRLEHKLGEGGMGAVYRGVHVLMNRPVAVKVLRSELGARPDIVRRFHREALLTSKLDHESCVRVTDVSPEGSERVYLVMELLQGEDLASLLRRGPVSARRACEIGAAVAAALAHAHEQGVIHRDLKPENVFLHRRGAREVVKVVDFGIARSELEESITRAGEVFGTPEFMSPEQMNDAASVDARSDVYSLAATMFVMLTGRSPASDAVMLKVLALVSTGTIERSVRKFAPAVPEWLDRLIARCLSLAPSNRPSSAAEVEGELLRGLGTLSPDSMPRAPSSPDLLGGTDSSRLSPSSRLSYSPRSALMVPTVVALGSPTTLSPLSERRQITILVGEVASIADLTERLDIDDLRELLRSFRAASETVLERYGGRLTRSLNHGFVAYVGYPKAAEDDAERAVAAAIEVTKVVKELAFKTSSGEAIELAAAIGVHTGQVMIEDEGGPDSITLVGAPPMVATRLAATAGAGEVIASGATHALLQGSYRSHARKDATIPGLALPVSTFLVIEELAFGSRFERKASAGLSPLVGRKREVDMLESLWQGATSGAGNVVVVSGEAGLGKSRVLDELKSRLGEGPSQVFEMQCWEHGQASAFRPVAQLLERQLGLAGLTGTGVAGAVSAKLDKLEAGLGALGMDASLHAPLLAALLGLEVPGRYADTERSFARRKSETISAILTFILKSSEQRPLLFIAEDLHWVDPSTLELLDLVADQAPSASILLVATVRPEAELAIASKSHVVKLPLARLAAADVKALLASLARKPLPEELVEHLLRTSDGVPLFAEESTKMMLESGALVEVDGRYTLAGRLAHTAAPASLQDSLMARLDRLPTAKETAQRGAVLGREFSFAMIRAISPDAAGSLPGELRQLVDAGLLFQRGLPPDATYQFKHALVRDIAYRSLPRRRQQQVHQDVAYALVRDFPKLTEAEPERVASHLAEAGALAMAFGYWVMAGQRALDRGTHVEAASHLRRAVDTLTSLPPSPERDQKERSVQLALGLALMATQGYGGPDVVSAYERVRELIRSTSETREGDAREHFSALRGTWLYYTGRGAFDAAAELIPLMKKLAEASGERSMLLQALYPSGVNSFHRGELAAAEQDLEEACRLYDREEQKTVPRRYGVADPLSGSLCYVGAVRWIRGDHATGLAKNEEAVALAEGMKHPFTVAYATYALAWIYQMQGDVAKTLASGMRTLEVAKKEQFRFWLGLGMMITSWAKAMQRGPEDGGALDDMIRGLAAFRASGAEMMRTPQIAAAAELCAARGRVETGLELVAQGLDTGVGRGERFFRAELVRVQGELLLAKGDESGAEAAFAAARDEARRRGALSFELRAQMSLANVARRRGPAIAELVELLARFDDQAQVALDVDLSRARMIIATSASPDLSA